MVNIFGNIAFLNEGEQAEEYKKRKAEEATKREREEEERQSRRSNAEYPFVANDKQSHDDTDKFSNIGAFMQRHYEKNNNWEEYYGKGKYDREAIDRHMRRHPEQWNGDKYIGSKKESSIFKSVTFLDESGSFKAKKEIKNSDDYSRMKEITKELKKEKDSQKRIELRDEGIEIIDKLIAEAENIPSDGFFEWIGRFIIRQFDNGFRLFINMVLGFYTFKCTKYMTKSDFLDQLYEIKEDLNRIK